MVPRSGLSSLLPLLTCVVLCSGMSKPAAQNAVPVENDRTDNNEKREYNAVRLSVENAGVLTDSVIDALRREGVAAYFQRIADSQG